MTNENRHRVKSTGLSTETPGTNPKPRDKTDPLYGEHTREFYNVNLSLRSANAAVVAIDTAEPGQYFFIPKGKKFTRLAGSYETNAATANKKIKWVYGFLGKEENGKWVADHSRRGWVPQRVVELSPETTSQRNA